jgi:hypothetical protein
VAFAACAILSHPSCPSAATHVTSAKMCPHRTHPGLGHLDCLNKQATKRASSDKPLEPIKNAAFKPSASSFALRFAACCNKNILQTYDSDFQHCIAICAVTKHQYQYITRSRRLRIERKCQITVCVALC